MLFRSSPNPCLPCPCPSNSAYAFPVSATFTCEVDTVSPRSTTPCAANHVDAFRAAVTGFSRTAAASYASNRVTFDARQLLFFTNIMSEPCTNSSVLANLGKTESTFLLTMECGGQVVFDVSAYDTLWQGIALGQWASPQQWQTYCQIGQAAYASIHTFRVYSAFVKDAYNLSTTLPCDGQSAAIRTPWFSVRGELNTFDAFTCPPDLVAEFDASVRIVCTFNYLP